MKMSADCDDNIISDSEMAYQSSMDVKDNKCKSEKPVENVVDVSCSTNENPSSKSVDNVTSEERNQNYSPGKVDIFSNEIVGETSSTVFNSSYIVTSPKQNDSVDEEKLIDKDSVHCCNRSEDYISLRLEAQTNTGCLFHVPLLVGEDNSSTSGPKTEEEQLIEDVQNFYPEIEFSKTVSNVIQEGKAYVIKQSKNVFYNPVQEFNRDLSVLAISVFSEEHRNDPRLRSRGTKRKANDNDSVKGGGGAGAEVGLNVNTDAALPATDGGMDRTPGVKYNEGIVILEALSATGLRSIRYAKEVPGVKEIVANDISIAAVESIKKNIEYNSVVDLVSTSHNDASLLMYSRKAQGNLFDVVDLDPYGCPSRFLDAAVQSVRDGGLLLITCTDMAVLAGNSPETCYVKYGAISLRNPACHEMALRIALQCIESHANRYGRYIVPQLSFSADFYIRVIVKVYTSPAMCKRTTSKLCILYQCVGCQSLNYWPLGLTENCNKSTKYHLPRGPPVAQQCPHCASTYYQGGPIWSDPLHNTTFVEKMLSQMRTGDTDFATEKRMEGMLELIKEELVGTGTLLYHTIDSLCSKVHCEVVPRNKFVSAILHAGYKVTLSHAAPNSVKTNAPAGVIWDIIRCWVQVHPVNPKRLNQGSVAEKLLSVIPRFQANFDLHPEVMPRNRKKLLRYQQNPLPFWGPGTRDKNNCPALDRMSKSYANQNKKCKKANTEREMKAQMKAAINSKNIDIIEVVTLTDDDDDNDFNGNGVVEDQNSGDCDGGELDGSGDGKEEVEEKAIDELTDKLHSRKSGNEEDKSSDEIKERENIENIEKDKQINLKDSKDNENQFSVTSVEENCAIKNDCVARAEGEKSERDDVNSNDGDENTVVSAREEL